MTIKEAIKFLEEHDYVVIPKDKVGELHIQRFITALELLQAKAVDFNIKERVMEYSAEAIAEEILRTKSITWTDFNEATLGGVVLQATIKVIRP